VEYPVSVAAKRAEKLGRRSCGRARGGRGRTAAAVDITV
jgi:hypothetical protein